MCVFACLRVCQCVWVFVALCVAQTHKIIETTFSLVLGSGHFCVSVFFFLACLFCFVLFVRVCFFVVRSLLVCAIIGNHRNSMPTGIGIWAFLCFVCLFVCVLVRVIVCVCLFVRLCVHVCDCAVIENHRN